MGGVRRCALVVSVFSAASPGAGPLRRRRTGSRSSSSTSSEATRSSSSATGRTTGRTATPVELRPPPIASATSPPASRPGSRASSGAPPTAPGSAPAARGSARLLAVRSRPLRATVEVALWCPDGVRDGVPLPLLVVHDGPEYERQTGLTARAAELIRTGRVPPHRIALLDPGPRDEWYSASALYARALTGEVLPALGRAVAVAGPPAGMGASLGGLAMLHAQRRVAGRVLRAVPAVRGVLHAPLRPHGDGLLALRADRALRARRPARPGLRPRRSR